jgi:hypothetical protein
MDSRGWRAAAVAAALIALAGCKARAGVAVDRPVTITWQVNHEKGVNGPGGGYRVAVAGRAPVDLPWPAPTTLTTVLRSGTRYVSVEAYEPDPAGGGTVFSPATTLAVSVP